MNKKESVISREQIDTYIGLLYESVDKIIDTSIDICIEESYQKGIIYILSKLKQINQDLIVVRWNDNPKAVARIIERMDTE